MKAFAQWVVKAAAIITSLAIMSELMGRFERKILHNVEPRDWRRA